MLRRKFSKASTPIQQSFNSLPSHARGRRPRATRRGSTAELKKARESRAMMPRSILLCPALELSAQLPHGHRPASRASFGVRWLDIAFRRRLAAVERGAADAGDTEVQTGGSTRRSARRCLGDKSPKRTKRRRAAALQSADRCSLSGFLRWPESVSFSSPRSRDFPTKTRGCLRLQSATNVHAPRAWPRNCAA